MSAASRLLERLPGAKQTAPGRWMCRCPSHEDGRPSLSIREVEDRVLINCLAGCGAGDVLAAIGLRMSDLFDKPIAHHLAPIRRPFDPMEVLIAVGHEIIVTTLIAHDMGASGRGDREQIQRLQLAEQRLTKALSLIDLPVPDEIKRIRRAAAPDARR